MELKEFTVMNSRGQWDENLLRGNRVKKWFWLNRPNRTLVEDRP